MFSMAQLDALRGAEVERVVAWFPPGARVLELGAGTGQQSRELAARGFDVEAIELTGSNYAGDRCFPIADYDGAHIPFPDLSFDIVYSSNVLEHVPDLAQMHKEIRRVLRSDGRAVHVLPTHSWRFWTTVSAFPTGVQCAATLKSQLRPHWPPTPSEARRLIGASLQAGRHLASAFCQHRHGERGNLLTETWLFHPEWWRRNFRLNGFEILRDEPMGLFYTGNMTFGARWSLAKRAHLAQILGSACHIFELHSTSDRGAESI